MEHKRDIEERMEKNMKYFVIKVFKVFMMILLAAVLFLLANYVLMRLWNWLMPDLFGLATINYWQALGIFIMAKLLFGFGLGGDEKNKSKHKKSRKSSHRCSSLRRDFEDWKHYDEFWKEEGEEAYKAYVERIKNENHDTL